ncbi:hypothetical protein [Kineosporia sp. NBRC 101731]|uniref:hypothetical protein n=1 Tax=Kineosporia sp. NBRC 101731 TaxID=3032199 RepID=UPI0024A30253|nr:hypothetical protein [Kineosporia sp. NBRC 101731]GLY33228.1 hypothetical protein Kisp02_65930 [Kineosporia sp. NBRC 101731]
MTARRGLLASIVTVAVIAGGLVVWQQVRSTCPDAYSAAVTYLPDDEVAFNGRVWRATRSTISENPSSRGTTWADAGTC